jgi:hypothetical protein
VYCDAVLTTFSFFIYTAAVGSQRESSFPSLVGFIWVFLHRISFLFLSFCGGYSVSGEGARLWLWLWIACSRCGLANGLRFGFLALGLGIGRDGIGGGRLHRGRDGLHLWSSVLPPQSASATPITRTGMCLATPGDVDVRAKKGNRGADEMGRHTCVGV